VVPGLARRVVVRVLVGGHERQLELDRDVDGHRREAAPARRRQRGGRVRLDAHPAAELLEPGVHAGGGARAVPGPVAGEHLVELRLGHVPAPVEAGLLDFVNIDAHLDYFPRAEKGLIIGVDRGKSRRGGPVRRTPPPLVGREESIS
jgi:hypothetical protein